MKKNNENVVTLLSNTLINLINEEQYEAISISELCSKAGVGRMSFYRNFNSKDDILIKYLYEIDCEKFTSSLKNLNENVYDKPQVSKEISDLRSPYMFVEDLYCETNKSTKEKLVLLRRVITDMNIDIQVKVIK